MKNSQSILGLVVLACALGLATGCGSSEKKIKDISSSLNKVKQQCFFSVIQAENARSVREALEACRAGIEKLNDKAGKITDKEDKGVKGLLAQIDTGMMEFTNPNSAFAKKIEGFRGDEAIARALQKLLDALKFLKQQLE